MIKLYHYPHSPFCRKVRIVLEEKKVSYTAVPVDLEVGGQHASWFVEKNPFRRVPVLEGEGFVLFESSVINEYLEEIYPTPAMLPLEPLARARVRLLERIHDEHLAPLMRVLFKQYYLTKPVSRDGALVANTFHEIQEVLRYVDGQLEGKSFFGSNFSLADAAFVHILNNMVPQFNVDLASHGNIQRWLDRIRLLDSVKRSDPGAFRNPSVRKLPFKKSA